MKSEICFILFLSLCSSALFASETLFKAARFGEISIFGIENNRPEQLVLFLSGDEGWNKNLAEMARMLVEKKIMVVGISTPTYLKNIKKIKEKCHYPASDFESLSHFIQRKYKFPEHVQPTLAGSGSGATLVYAILAQAPSGTFRGAISLGFCSTLNVDRPLCKGQGLTQESLKDGKGINFRPIAKIGKPWFVLGGYEKLTCDLVEQQKFVKAVQGATLIASSDNQQAQVLAAVSALNIQEKNPVIDVAELKDLPIVEEHAIGSKNETLALIISGDGGWASIDKEIAEVLKEKGISVVGIDSLRYFWSEQTPEQFGKDVETVINYYLKEWKLKKVVLIGYSMGADVLPFALNRISAATRQKSLGVAYLGLSQKADFEIEIANWLGVETSEKGLDILPELKKLSVMKSLCIRGTDEDDSGCDYSVSPRFQKKILSGGHHFGGDFKALAQIIIDFFGV